MSAPAGPPGGVPEAEPVLDESAASTADLQTAAVRGSWWTAVQAIVGLPLSVGANLINARVLGPHGYGVLASYMTAYILILTVLNAGISDATIQWGAAAWARGDRGELLRICRKCAGFHIGVEAPAAAIAAFALLHRERLAVQIVGAVFVTLTMVLGTTMVALTAMSKNAPLAKISLVFGMASQLAVVTAAVQTHSSGAAWVARLAVLSLVPAAAIAIAPADVRRACFTPRLPRQWPPGFARYAALTLAAGLVTALVFSRSELLVLDAYGNAEAAGVFALAAGLALQITAPVDALLGPLIPAAASLLEIGRHRAAGAVLRGIRLSVLATAPITVIAIPALAVLTPKIYGAHFSETATLFIGLAVVSCLQSVMHPVTAFVTALRKPITLLVINGAALVLDLSLVFALVPVLGAAGAVWGNCVGQVTSLFALLTLLGRHLELRLFECIKAMAPFVVVAVASIAGSVVGISLGRTSMPAGLVVGVGSALLIGYAGVYVLGGLAKEDDLSSIESGLPEFARSRLSWMTQLGLVRH